MNKIIVPAGTQAQQVIHCAESIIEYHIEQDAQVTVLHEQNVPLTQTYEHAITFFMAPGSSLHYFPIILGASMSTLEIDIVLHENAQAFVHGAYAMIGKQECAIITRQKHVGKNSQSTLVINGIANQKAQVRYQGIIVIEQHASRVTASQENKTILCSSAARAVSIPSLEVKNNDVQCAHGSAVGPLQQELIYYLQARGIPALHAQQMLLESFFGKTLADMHDEEQKKYFIEQLVAKASIREHNDE